MADDGPRRAPQRGIPDGALIGVLVLLVGATATTWLSTGIAGLVSHQEWPDKVRFSRSGTAIRELTAEPGDVAAAWPDTPPEALPPPTTFWIVFGTMLLLVMFLAGFALWVWLRLTLRQAVRRETVRRPPEEGGKPEKTL